MLRILLAGLILVAPVSLRAADAQTEITWYGFFKGDLAYDTAASSHGNFAMWVKAHADGAEEATHNLTANQTRIGFNMKREDVTGKLEFDFYGGNAQNKSYIQLRKAYVDLPLGPVMLRAGQDSDVISPLVPSTINYTVCWGAGNIGYRRPQMRVYHQSGGLYWAAALARNITPDLDGNAIVDGEDSALPVVQGRLAYTFDAGDAKVTLGGSGHYGMMDTPALAGEDGYSTWSANGEAAIVLSPRLKVLGEFYTGSNLATYFGSILNADTVDGLASLGGWANVQFKATDDLALSLGGAYDSVDEDDLAGAGARSANQVIFANAQKTIGSGVKAGVEVSYWATEYPNAPVGTEGEPANLRVQFAITGSI